jgi:two-component system sensor histidine kinase CreC
VSTTTRILIGFLLILSVAFYFLMDTLIKRVERQYLEAAEEPMVDAAHVLASLVEQEFQSGKFDPEKFRRAFAAADSRTFEALIYNQFKHQVDLDLYITDAEGTVLFHSLHPAHEGTNYLRHRDVALTLRGKYGARSTRTDEDDKLSSIMYVGAPIHDGSEIVGMVSVAKPQASMWAFIEETQSRIFYYGWTIFLLILLAAVLVSHWLSRPGPGPLLA